jgi:hypothetical protein
VLPKKQIPEVRLQYDIPSIMSGPVADGDTLGHVIVLDGGEVMTTVDAICPLTKPGDQIQPVSSAVSAGNSAFHLPFAGQSTNGKGGSLPVVTSPMEKNQWVQHRAVVIAVSAAFPANGAQNPLRWSRASAESAAIADGLDDAGASAILLSFRKPKNSAARLPMFARVALLALSLTARKF